MSTLAIDTCKLLTALRGAGKSANFTAEEDRERDRRRAGRCIVVTLLARLARLV
jgi:hypothetical protein